MKTFISPNSKLKNGLISGAATLALLGTPTAAIAHGSHHNWGHKRGEQHYSQQQCERWEDTLNQRAEWYRNSLQAQLNERNEWFTKLQAHVTNNSLTVENYDALVTDATEKQAATTDAINNLQDVDLDCSDRDSRTRAHKEAAEDELGDAIREARQALREYKQSLDTLLVAVIES